MQEIDDAIQKAESTSMTMERVKVQEPMLRSEITFDVNASPESVSTLFVSLPIHTFNLFLHLFLHTVKALLSLPFY